MSFIVKGRPTITAMIKSKTVEGVLKEIEELHSQGADAFGFQIDMLNPDERDDAGYKRIIFAMKDKPCYITNYFRNNPVKHSDDELNEELLRIIDYGTCHKLLDIRMDCYDRQPGEVTYNEQAVEKQMKLIDRIHSMGAEVLMSAHVLKYIPGNDVLDIAMAQKMRGADVAKIVTLADSDEELSDNLKTSVMLKEKLGIPSLFLCNGTHCRRHRILGPVLGTDMFLTVHNDNEGQNQPTIKRAREQLILAGFEL